MLRHQSDTETATTLGTYLWPMAYVARQSAGLPARGLGGADSLWEALQEPDVGVEDRGGLAVHDPARRPHDVACAQQGIRGA